MQVLQGHMYLRSLGIENLHRISPTRYPEGWGVVEVI